MKILINTTEEMIELNGELLIPGEWLHVDDSFIVPDDLCETVESTDIDGNLVITKIPYIQTPQQILDEKLTHINKADSKDKTQTQVKELNIEGFIAGIKEAKDKYGYK